MANNLLNRTSESAAFQATASPTVSMTFARERKIKMPDMKFNCPKCGQSLEAPSDMAGEAVPCPSCQTPLKVPSPSVPKSSSTSSRQRARSSKRLLLSVFAGAAVVLALALTGFFLVRGRTAGQTSRSDTRPSESPRIRRVKATLHGGAWVTKKTGNSEVLRGLDVHLLRAQATNAQLLRVMKTRLAAEEATLAKARKKLAFDNEWAQKRPDNESMQADARRSAAATRLMEAVVTQRKEALHEMSTWAPEEACDLKGIYEIIPKPPPESDQPGWQTIASEQLVDQTHTGIDGTYELPLTGEPCYLYARYETEYSLIEWFIPANATSSGRIKIDLDNSNAAFIHNK
jgi:hypothetical protein